MLSANFGRDDWGTRDCETDSVTHSEQQLLRWENALQLQQKQMLLRIVSLKRPEVHSCYLENSSANSHKPQVFLDAAVHLSLNQASVILPQPNLSSIGLVIENLIAEDDLEPKRHDQI